MLTISQWDEIGGEWTESELDLPANCRDGKLISNTLDAVNADCKLEDYELEVEDDEETPFWDIKKVTDTGDLLVIETSSDRGHQSIIIVNYRDQEIE